MNNLDKFNQIFEANIRDNKGIPQYYIDDIDQKGKEKYSDGFDPMKTMQLMHKITNSIQGKEEELVDAVKEIIIEQYGSILDGVDLDLKIVKPNDSEKREMTNKFVNTPYDAKFQLDVELEEEGKEVQVEADINEIDKRKILNALMQGEALNVHSLLHNNKEKLNSIVPNIVEDSLELIKLNHPLYWDENMPKMHELGDMPTPPNMNPMDMANAMEVEYNQSQDEESEENNIKPSIKVRALDVVMIIHETVKGIYELIMANALPNEDDSELKKTMYRKVIAETDTLKDEHEDIMYGEFIAADLRDYIYRFLDEHYPNSLDIPNIREFVYGGLASLEANKFLDFMKKVLTEDIESADFILKKTKIVDNIIKEFDDFNNSSDIESYENDDQNNIEDTILDYSEMSQSELTKALNAALDDGDLETAKEIGKFIKK